MHQILRYILICLCLTGSVQAARAPFQSNWEPNRYKVICKPADSCVLSDSVHQKTSELMPKAVNGIRQLGFGPPALWGQRGGEGPDDYYMEVYERDDESIAQAIAMCPSAETGGAFRDSHMSIGKMFTQFDDRDHLLYYFMSHEVFHIVQFEQAFYRSNCQIPGWIFEGMATAVGHAATRKNYPGPFPAKVDDRVAENFSGLRRYDKPLPHRSLGQDGAEIWTGDPASYRTSSFWRHLAEAHYRGRYSFLTKYMDRTAWYGDWVGWLKANVETGTGSGLGMVFAGFLADYAGWGDDNFPGTYYGRSRWLNETLGGCETLYLNKQEAVDYIDVDLLPLSGKCVEVRVSALGPNGIEEGQSAAVQIAAVVMSGSPSNRDGLNLSLAFSNDKERFHCARQVKQKRKKGLGRCLFSPDDGKIRMEGSVVDAKLWNVIAQKKGDKPEKRQEPGERKGELVNVYTMSYTPITVASKHTKYGGKDPVSARFFFILDVAKIQMDGETKEDSVGFVSAESDPQTTVPKVNANGNRVASFSKPDQFQPKVAIAPDFSLPQQFQGKLSQFFVAPMIDGSSTGSALMIIPGKADADGEFEPQPLSVGQTGSFEAGLIGTLNGEHIGGYGTPPSKIPGTLTVHEFSDLVLRADFSGNMCRIQDLETDKRLQETRPCRNPIPVSGEIIKAFVGTRLPGQHMVVERTPSTEMYRKAAEQGMSEWSLPDEQEPNTGSPSTNSTTDVNTGDSLKGCACTCEERATTLRLAEEFKTREQAGEELNMSDLMGLMSCNNQCQSDYLMCALEGGKDRKARKKQESKKAQEDLKSSGECDCSCSNLSKMQDHNLELIQKLQSGSQAAIEELKNLGLCIAACQTELMQCLQP